MIYRVMVIQVAMELKSSDGCMGRFPGLSLDVTSVLEQQMANLCVECLPHQWSANVQRGRLSAFS